MRRAGEFAMKAPFYMTSGLGWLLYCDSAFEATEKNRFQGRVAFGGHGDR